MYMLVFTFFALYLWMYILIYIYIGLQARLQSWLFWLKVFPWIYPPLSLLRLVESLPTWPSHVPWTAPRGTEPYRVGMGWAPLLFSEQLSVHLTLCRECRTPPSCPNIGTPNATMVPCVIHCIIPCQYLSIFSQPSSAGVGSHTT